MPKKTAQDMKDLAEWMATHPHGDGNSSNGAHPEGSAGERPLELTDTGNANRLFQGYGEDFRWVPKLRQFIVWTGHAWELDVFNQVQEFAKKSANDLLLVAHGIQNVEVKDAVVKWSMGSRSADRIGSSIRLLKSIRPAQVDFKELDTHADKLAVLNGVYNLRTGALEPGKREDYLTQVVPIIARPGAPHPKWDEFLRLLFCTGAEDDADMLEYIRLVLGYWVTGSVSEQAFYLLFGDGDNGKSTFLKVLWHVLGGTNGFVHHIPVEVIVQRRGYANIEHHKADCRGRRVIYTEEVEQNDRLYVDFVKEITGGGMQTAARKYEHAVEFPFIGKLIIATNNLPELPNIDYALKRRVRAIPFDKDLPKLFRDLGREVPKQEDVVADLLQEREGILDYLVQAAVEWYAGGSVGSVTLPARVAKATHKYLLEQDPVLKWRQIACEKDNEEGTAFTLLYQSYLLVTDSDPKYTSKKWFAKQLVRLGFEAEHTVSGRVYRGPALTIAASNAATEAREREKDNRGDFHFAPEDALNR